MSLNSAELALLSHLLDRLLRDSLIQKIYQPRDEVFVLESYGGSDGRCRLQIDLTRGRPLIFPAKKKLKNPEKPTALCTVLRRHLLNARVRRMEALEGDRICIIHLEKMTDEGVRERRLILELIPGYPLLILADQDNKVLAMTQAVDNQHRKVRRGLPWVPPPPIKAHIAEGPLFSFLPDWTEETLLAQLEESCDQQDDQIDRTLLAREVNRALKRQRRKVNSIEKDIRRLEEQSEGGDLGELLKSVLHEVTTGMTEVRARDWLQEGEVWRTIPLDPSRSPQENLEQYFKKARKSARGLEAARERLKEQRQSLRRLMELEEALSHRQADLESLGREAASLGLQVSRTAKQPGRKKVVQVRRLPYKVYISKDGLEIRVGRSSRDNDELTFQHCRGNEWWLHADGYAGSHVVVKTSDELPQETMLDAATLAIAFSKASSAGKQAVSLTRRKNVTKYKGARPGQVLLRTHKSILIRFEQSRMERLEKSMPAKKS